MGLAVAATPSLILFLLASPFIFMVLTALILLLFAVLA